MIDPYRLVFDRLHAEGAPDAQRREQIYAECRAHVIAVHPGEVDRIKVLEAVEKVIRRQEMQALYEESLDGG